VAPVDREAHAHAYSSRDSSDRWRAAGAYDYSLKDRFVDDIGIDFPKDACGKRKPSSRFSQLIIWFQLALFWSTILRSHVRRRMSAVAWPELRAERRRTSSATESYGWQAPLPQFP
jgi:hypothetical protein